MSQKIKAVEIKNGNRRPVEIAVGGADSTYVDTAAPVVLLSVGTRRAWHSEIALEHDDALELAATIMARLGQQAERKAA